MIRIVALAAALLTIGAGMTDAQARGKSRAQARDQIRIVGSSTVFPFAATVAETFRKTYKLRAPVIEVTGTGGGIRMFCQGATDQYPYIVNASRLIQPSERAACAAHGVGSITEVRIGLDGIVLAHAREAPDMNLTRAQLWLALARTVPVNGRLAANPYTRWNQIDPALPDQRIEVYGPPPTSGTRDALADLVMSEGCRAFREVRDLDAATRRQVCAQMREDGRFIEAGENDRLIVQRLRADPDAHGIFGFGALAQNAGTLTAVAIDGETPSFETIAAGRYPVTRSLYLYIKDSYADIVPGIREYVAEFTDEHAWGPDGYLTGKGLVPLPPEQRATMRRQAVGRQPMDKAALPPPVTREP